MKLPKDPGRLLLSIVVCQLAGIIGSLFTMPAIPSWYAALNKPAFTPSGMVIGTVWIVLYTLMGISLYLVWQKGVSRKTKPALYAFGIQLALNALWSFLFFGLRSPLYGLIGIVALWFAILVTIITFRKISMQAAWLLVPYIAWVTFATFLNWSIFVLV
jgi:tryptophan-rich sensory protein